MNWTTVRPGTREGSLGKFRLAVSRRTANKWERDNGCARLVWWAWTARHPFVGFIRDVGTEMCGNEPTEAKAKAAAEKAVRAFVAAEFTITEDGA